MISFHFVLFITSIVVKIMAVPSAICRAEFRWDDCGLPPKAVMYYWKQASRCEVGIWKGCLPNPNMFTDEYECNNMCVFQDHPAQRTEAEEDTTDITSSDTTGGNETISTANTTDTTDETTGHSGNTTSDANNSTDTTDAHSDSADSNGTTDHSDDIGTATDASGDNETTAADTTEAASTAAAK